MADILCYCLSKSLANSGWFFICFTPFSNITSLSPFRNFSFWRGSMLSFHGISGPECETNQVNGLIKIRPLGYEKDRPWTQFPGMGTDKRKRNHNRYVMKFPGNIVRIRFLYEQLESWQYYNACIVYERKSTREKLHHVRQNLTINRISSHWRSSRRKLLANMIKS